MARTFSFDANRFEGFETSPSNITVDWEENGRAFPYTKEDVKDLLGDFEAGRGIQTPLIVQPWKVEAGKGLKLVAGYRRLYAALEYSKDHPEFQVPVVIEKPQDALAALVLNIRENVARKDLSHIDLGKNALRLLESGMDESKAAEILGVSQAQVTQHLKLVRELPERTQNLIHRGFITADDGFALLKIVDPEERERLVQQFLEQHDNLVSVSEEGSGSGEGTEPKDSGKPSRRGKGTTSIREAAREAGHNVGAIRLPAFKKYLALAIEEEGPGSNKGEIELKKSLLEFLAGELTEKQLDNRFEKYCKQKGA